ncbi:MAG: tripartite tricarboxylate transporter TctB family protein [Faecousia sp.]
MKKFNKTYIMGILCLLFAAWIAWQTSSIPTKLVSNEPGPKMFPYISAAGIAVMAVLSMIFDGKKEKEAKESGEAKPYLDKAGWLRMGLVLLECLIFAVSMNLIGFWLTAMIGMFVFIWTLKGKKKINIVFAIILCVGLSSLCYFGFTRGFHIPLPSGTLWKALGIKML